MAYPTPPPTNSNFKKFLEPMNKLTYYEDLYGKRNEDEELDRFPDDCKDESDCEDGVGRTAKSGIGRGFFSKYIEPRSKKKSTVLPGVNHFREVKKRNGQYRFTYIIHFRVKLHSVVIHFWNTVIYLLSPSTQDKISSATSTTVVNFPPATETTANTRLHHPLTQNNPSKPAQRRSLHRRN